MLQHLPSVAGLAALAVLSGCTGSPPPDITRQVPVDASFHDLGLDWGRTASGIDIRLGFFEGPGSALEICGAYAVRGSDAREHTRSVLQAIGVAVEGRTVLMDISYFTRVSSAGALPGAAANCRATGTEVPPPDADIEILFEGRNRYSG
ncbi:hypothetical protein [Poseidonocella sp. HB161398]|uniref:hypothetical protein n=1 Tax=Poseidonocella sp. HB161398 TaxID=2320855 RepID=UPI001109B7AC|nr:hypothetical protein [Poseidonocella sp. HB161398]